MLECTFRDVKINRKTLAQCIVLARNECPRKNLDKIYVNCEDYSLIGDDKILDVNIVSSHMIPRGVVSTEDGSNGL